MHLGGRRPQTKQGCVSNKNLYDRYDRALDLLCVCRLFCQRWLLPLFPDLNNTQKALPPLRKLQSSSYSSAASQFHPSMIDVWSFWRSRDLFISWYPTYPENKATALVFESYRWCQIILPSMCIINRGIRNTCRYSWDVGTVSTRIGDGLQLVKPTKRTIDRIT